MRVTRGGRGNNAFAAGASSLELVLGGVDAEAADAVVELAEGRMKLAGSG